MRIYCCYLANAMNVQTRSHYLSEGLIWEYITMNDTVKWKAILFGQFLGYKYGETCVRKLHLEKFSGQKLTCRKSNYADQCNRWQYQIILTSWNTISSFGKCIDIYAMTDALALHPQTMNTFHVSLSFVSLFHMVWGRFMFLFLTHPT